MNEKKYKTPEAFRTAIEAGAKTLRDETGEGLDMQRRKVAIDAFLCRVAISGTPLVLKGGYLLHLRYNIGVRPTKDLDAALQEKGLEALNQKEIERHMREALQAAALTPVDDFFRLRSANQWQILA